jgi:D-alanyl-D-alanine carboxypeptidase (penicillin-binding protein 5/6)
MTLRLLVAIVLLGALQAPPCSAQALLPADRLDGPPVVSAKGWAIADGKTGKVLWGTNDAAPLVIASTTKIMTAHLVLELAAKDPAVLDETLTVSERAARTGGSSAKIKAGEKYLVRDLLYGLMLPSGNDAAVALGEHFGERLREKNRSDEEPLSAFVAAMNRRAAELRMSATKYLDPHGNSANRASPRDLCALAFAAMQNPRFREYVRTRSYKCEVTDAKGEKRPVTWENTNRLLGIEGYDGIKTGTTGSAGSCLVSAGRYGDDSLIVVVLGATSNDSRYIDSRNLYRWAWQQRGHKAK